MSEPYDIARFYKVMEEQDSDAFTFEVQRKPQPGRTISAEAADQLKEVFGAFLAARLSASLHKRGPQGPGHGAIRMEMRLWIDGESVTVPLDIHPWYSLTDGEHRRYG